MNEEIDIIRQTFKYVTGDSLHVCRLCFTSTEVGEIHLEDSVTLKQYYVDETMTYRDIFQALAITLESSLPQVLCSTCAHSTVNAYLLLKLCQFSNNMWNDIMDRFSTSLDQSDKLRPSVNTVYLIVRKKDNLMLTSKKSNKSKSKRIALSRVKDILNSRKTYQKVKMRPSTVICEECGEKFSSKFQLLRHNSKVHSNIQYSCPQCLKLFASQVQMEDHAERLHYPKKIQCPKCAKMFSTEKMLKYHDKLHHIAAICKLCFVQFPSKKILKTHMDKHEVSQCPHCDKSFINKHSFKCHLKICGKQGERIPQYFCDICGKGYIGKNGLRSHLKTDHGFGNVLSCNWCGKRFDAISRLKNHIVKHTKEKNFHCEQCGGKFVTQAALVYHIRLHTGERPFPCDMCDESFLSASRRMEHKRRKHFGPTKECTICHVKFVTGHNLKKHMQRHLNPQSKLFAPETVDPYVSDLQSFPLE